jgi:hypothetical protein
VNNELERVWKEAAVAQSEVLSRHLPGRTEVNYEKLRRVRVPTETQTRYLSNTSQKRYRLGQYDRFLLPASLSDAHMSGTDEG